MASANVMPYDNPARYNESLASCGRGIPSEQGCGAAIADSQLQPVNWTDLASWRTDDHLAAFAAYRTSCQALRKIPRTDDHGLIRGALWNVCRKATDLQPKNGVGLASKDAAD
jgi:hypothetical protein